MPGRGQSGATLIEVLVVVLVLSLGLLGVASLQLMALRNSQQSLQQSLATMYSYALIDSMRANGQAARGGAYNRSAMCSAPSGDSLAEVDLAFWLTAMQGQLGPETCADVSCTAAGVCGTTVRWTLARDKSSTATASVRTNL